MDIKSVFNSSFDDVDGVCIAVSWNIQHEQQHIGLLFVDADGETKLLHLAWHYSLQKDFPDNSYLWLDTFIDPINKIHLAAFCASVFESNPNGIPYGLYMDDSGFSENGLFIPENEYSGMSCATFVINIFHSQGHLIIDFEKWSVRENDGIWQEKILQILDRYAPKEYVEYQRHKIQQGAARFKPEEVAVAAALLNPPHSLEYLSNHANSLLNSMIEHAKKMATNEATVAD